MVSVDSIKALREQTGAGIMDCKRALADANGDLGKATEALKEKGLAKAAKSASRETKEGVVHSYIHGGGRVGALVEISCETDFVGRTADFQGLAHDVAMQVAAMAPKYIDASDMPADDEANPDEVCLLRQPFIKDPGKSIADLVTELAARVGENVRVRRFSRFALGEDEEA